MIEVGCGTSNVDMDFITHESLQKILMTILVEVRHAHIKGDIDLLNSLNVRTDQAENISAISHKAILNALLDEETVPFTFTLDSDMVDRILTRLFQEKEKERQLRELVNAGATCEMLSKLGFDPTSKGVTARRGLTKMRSTTSHMNLKPGRPKNLTIREVQRVRKYWEGYRNPGLVHPVDHLLQTAIYLDVSVSCIWKHLMEEPDSIAENTITEYPRWVYIMFPDWDKHFKSAPQEKDISQRSVSESSSSHRYNL